jgi:hypothetical protein
MESDSAAGWKVQQLDISDRLKFLLSSDNVQLFRQTSIGRKSLYLEISQYKP